MIERYEIQKTGREERLILYLNYNYEFASFNNIKKHIDLSSMIKKFIIDHNIAFKGQVVSLVVGGIFVGNVILKNNYHVQKYVVDEKVKYTSNEVYQKVNDNKKILESIQNLKDLNEKKVETQKQSIQNNTSKKTAKKASTSKKVVQKSTTNKTSNVNNKSTQKAAVDNNIYITLIRNGKEEKLELEEYLVGVVGAEMPASFNIEALKAQAIISRTYALKAKSKGKKLQANESNQSYKTVSQLKSLWGNNFDTYYNKIKSAVTKTKGMYLTYNGNYIEAVFHSTSNGQTESSQNVWGNSYPYLVNVESKYDASNPSYSKKQTISYDTLSKKLGISVSNETDITILSLTSGKRVNQIKVGDKTYRGVDIRNLLGLRSSDFTFEKGDNGITFTTKGYGHGVGLSQYGANGYAKNGYNYEKILKHYYLGVSIKK